MAHELTTCTFCGVGCGIYLETHNNKITGAYPSLSHPTSQGRLCVRGWHAHEIASSPDRLTEPLLKKNGKLTRVTWEEAFEFVAERLRAICHRNGPEAIGFLSSPRCSNEESYLLQKLARTLAGTNNVSHGAGVYSNNSVEVLLEMLGVPASTHSLADLTAQDAIIVDGIDLAQQMPTIGGVVLRAKLSGARLIVIDSRRQRLAEHAEHFLQLRPGTEALLYGAMAKVILDRGLLDRAFIQAHVRGYEQFVERVENFDLLWAARVCDLPADVIEAAAVTYAQARSASILYSTGDEARSSEAIQAMINMALLTGHAARNRSGILALTEQNNLQGVCDMGMLPNRLPGYRPVQDEAARKEFEALWGCRLPANAGMDARQMLLNGGRGKLKALWLSRYDPIPTAYGRNTEAALQQLDLVVVQHLFATSAMRYADVVLPVVAFGEEQVTFTNTERRIQLAGKVVEPPPGPLPAWQQLTRVAQAYGAPWHYAASAQVMEEISRAVPAYAAASHANLARDYGRQWPCTSDRPLGSRRVFGELVGRPFKFVPVRRPGVLPGYSPGHPFVLVLGHSLYYWNQNVLIQHSETLKREYRMLLLDYPEGFVELNSEDARRLDLRDGARVRLVSETGSAVTPVRVTPEVKRGTIFIPHFVRDVMEKLAGELPEQAVSASKPVCVYVEKA